MFKEKYGVKANQVSLWLGIYLITAIPTYILLYETNKLYFFIILVIENITTYYLLEEDFIDEMVENSNKASTMIFFIGTVVGLLALGALMFYKLSLFIILLVSETLFLFIKKFI